MPVVLHQRGQCSRLGFSSVPKSIMIEKPFVMTQLIVAISQLLNDRTAGAATLE